MNRFIKVWYATLFIKLLLAALLPLLHDESYYWFWGHHLQLSYFDHPPAVAWLFKLGQLFENLGQASRWPGIILYHCTWLIWAQILKNYFSEKQLLLFLALALLSPMTGLGSLLVTPDAPLLFFWSLSIFCLQKIMLSQKTKWYAFLGMALGLGFCSKYQIVLFVPSLLVFLLVEKRWQYLFTPKIFLTLGFGFLFCAPVLIWNYENNFDSFLFQLRHGAGASQWNPTWTIIYILGQVGLIFPTILFLALQKKSEKNLAWLGYFAFTPLVVFLLTSFRGRVEANWPAVAYPSLLALACLQTQKFYWLKNTAKFWAALTFCAFTLLGLSQKNFLIEKSKLKEFYEYDILVPIAHSYQPFYASSFQMAAKLSYLMRAPIYKLQSLGRRDFFDYLPESKASGEEFFIAMRQWDTLPEWTSVYSLVEKIPINSTFTLWHLKK